MHDGASSSRKAAAFCTGVSGTRAHPGGLMKIYHGSAEVSTTGKPKKQKIPMGPEGRHIPHRAILKQDRPTGHGDFPVVSPTVTELYHV